MIELGKSLHPVLRSLRRSPIFTLVTVATLAVAIGANSAVFSVVRGVLLKPLPFEEPERLVGVWHTAPGMGWETVNQSPALYFTYRDHSETFVDTGMWDNGQASVTELGEPEQVPVIRVTDGTLPLLGVQPHRGRFFNREDDSPGTAETVVLAHGYWQRRFGGAESALGKTLVVDGEPHEIIGVTGPGLHFLDHDPDLYLPFRFDRSQVFFGNFSYQGVARLKDGATLEQANAELAPLVEVTMDTFPLPGGFTREMAEEVGFAPALHPLREDAVGDVGATLWLLLGTVVLVLLVACANIANLVLVRSESRRQEMAIRAALGAGRRNLASRLLLEGAILATAGAALGLALAYGGLRLLVTLAPRGLPRLDEISIDSSVIAFTAGVAVAAAILVTLLPVLKVRLGELVPSLREDSRGAGTSRQRSLARNTLVAAQIALALMLMIGSGLMIRSFQALQSVEPGFQDPEEVLTLRLSIPRAQVPDVEEAARTFERIQQQLAALPGMSSVGMSSSITMDGRDSNDPIFVEDHPLPTDTIPPLRRFKWISPEYFSTMGNPLLAGRSISWADVHDRAPVAVITENLARAYWPEPTGALGKRIRPNPQAPWREIVGVVGNVYDDGPAQGPTAVVFWPQVQEDFWVEGIESPRSMAFALRSPRVGTPEFLDEVREAIWSVSPNRPLANVQPLTTILRRSTSRTSFALVMLAIAAATGLLLGAIGTYGVTSYSMAQRRREIGVRVAFGARPGDVRRLVLGHGLTLAVLGVAAGLAGAFALSRIMSSLLFEVAPGDPLTYGASSLGITALALAACWLPARRAARVSPIETLR